MSPNKAIHLNEAEMQLAQYQGVPDAGGQPEAGVVHPPEAHADAPALMRLEPGVGIWGIIVFLLLLFVLRKIAWNPILASLEERDKTVRESLEKAGQIQEESRRLTQEQNRILSEARTEANSILQTTKHAAEDLRRKIEQAAQEEKARILASANLEIEAAKKNAISELKKTTADLSIQIAEKLIRQSLDDAKHRQLVDDLVSEMTPSAAK